jgi:hypothetical protein
MSRAVCVRCGQIRSDFRQICPSCGHRAEGEGLLIAWLLSDAHLPAEQLASVAERVRAGESIRPSERMLDLARQRLGRNFETDPGMNAKERLLLLATSLLITPLVGWTLWWWWRTERPRASSQALALSMPATVLFTVGVVWLALN